MKKYFYTDLVEMDTLIAELDILEISATEKRELEKLAHDNLHHAILDAILSELANRDKKIFLANLEYETHDKIWKHLIENVEKIEEKIKIIAHKTKEELRRDIQEAKEGK